MTQPDSVVHGRALLHASSLVPVAAGTVFGQDLHVKRVTQHLLGSQPILEIMPMDSPALEIQIIRHASDPLLIVPGMTQPHDSKGVFLGVLGAIRCHRYFLLE
jgi:hypothetical protein